MPRPRPDDWLEDEVDGWCRSGVDCVVSLLTSIEVLDLGLRDEANFCKQMGIEFISFPIIDRSIPESIPDAKRLIECIAKRLENGQTIAIHCRMGIGRSGMIAAAALAQSGMNVDDAFQRIEDARGLSVPDTEEQRRWVQQLYDI